MLFFRSLLLIKIILPIFLIGAGLLLGACGGVDQPAVTAVSPTTVMGADFPTTTEANAPGLSDNFEAISPTMEAETLPIFPTRKPASAYAELEIITLLPPDAIQAIDNPQFLAAEEADQFYDPQEMVLGVSFNGDSRAYSAPFLSNHEIVNDTVGGVKIAVTW
jgi:hypothetical protein